MPVIKYNIRDIALVSSIRWMSTVMLYHYPWIVSMRAYEPPASAMRSRIHCFTIILGFLTAARLITWVDHVFIRRVKPTYDLPCHNWKIRGITFNSQEKSLFLQQVVFETLLMAIIWRTMYEDPVFGQILRITKRVFWYFCLKLKIFEILTKLEIFRISITSVSILIMLQERSS